MRPDVRRSAIIGACLLFATASDPVAARAGGISDADFLTGATALSPDIDVQPSAETQAARQVSRPSPGADRTGAPIDHALGAAIRKIAHGPAPRASEKET